MKEPATDIGYNIHNIQSGRLCGPVFCGFDRVLAIIQMKFPKKSTLQCKRAELTSKQHQKKASERSKRAGEASSPGTSVSIPVVEPRLVVVAE